MSGTDEVHVILDIPAGFNVDISAGGMTYHVQTEHGGTRNPQLKTHIYFKGEIVFSKKSDYSHLVGSKDFSQKLHKQMALQHNSAIEEFKKSADENRKRTEYFNAIEQLLHRKNKKHALKILHEALTELPDDPSILSYYGCLLAIVEKNHEEGIRMCKDALKRAEPDQKRMNKFLHAIFYLNLGRAYLAAGRKNSAIEAFAEGLTIDSTHRDLLWEIRKLGRRKDPVFSFLSRSNPINKYLGLLISKFKDR